MAYQLPDDPLGIGLRTRAAQARRAYEDENRELGKAHGQLVSFSNLGPLSDPMWDAFKQAYAERGVSKMSGGSLPMSRFGQSTVFDPSVQTGIDPRERFAARSMFRVR
jgi:hypothetical protein